MLITPKEFAHAAFNLSQQMSGHVGFDFETTGLNARRGDRAFVMGFTDTEGVKYSVRLTHEITQAMHLFFSNKVLKYCAHNAKFELAFLRHQFKIEVPTVWDTEVMERLVRNDHMKYGLQACAERMGMSKHQPMLDWLRKKGNKAAYSKAPEDILIPYVEQDAWLSWELCRRQIEQFRHWDKASPVPVREVVRLEMRTLPHLFNMEDRGLVVDVPYCKRAREYELQSIERCKSDFRKLTGVPFVDSRKTLQPIFDAHGISYGKTELGNASFAEGAISRSSAHPVVAAILGIRGGAKRVSAYWDNFLELEQNGLIHPTINQNKAQTGRMSIQDPSCQNWPTDDDDQEPEEFPVRRAFLAREGCVIVSMDYAQMELRKIVDEAEDWPMIEAIKTGKDFHQETADLAGVKRSLAKNGRFAKLYGAGVPRVADTLGVDLPTAQKVCDAIDATAPGTARYSRELIRFAKSNGYGFNFLGRRYFFSDPKFAYLFPNYRIQGACSEILRQAICDVGEFLQKHARPETFMLIPIHDELVFNFHPADLKLIPQIKQLMIGADMARKHLAMDVSVGVGENFHDLEDWHEDGDRGVLGAAGTDNQSRVSV